MTSALDAIMAGFRGTMPAVKVPAPTGVVNPPEAARVVAEVTAAEVAGEAPPEVDPVGAAPAPTAKPAEVLEAERAPKQRRTAAVVQAELDAMTAERDELTKMVELLSVDLRDASSERDALRTTVESLQAQLKEGRKEILGDLANAGQWAEENTALRARIAELEANALSPATLPPVEQCCALLRDYGFTVTLTYGGAR